MFSKPNVAEVYFQDAVANYEALLTLTNLASVTDSVRQRIMKAKALPHVEELWFDPSNEHLRVAAAELLLNMLYCENYFRQVVEVRYRLYS